MGYRGKTTEQNQARDLRAQGWTIKEIEDELGVSRSSVSIWVRDVEVDPEVWAERVTTRRNHGWEKRRETFALREAERLARDHERASALLGEITDRDRFTFGLALYAGEGAKRVGTLKFANSDPRMIASYLWWLRRFFEIDESRLRMRLYLHEGLDLEAALEFWSELTGIPRSQFGRPYRAVPDPSIRQSKHPMGCPSVAYSCTETHRLVMALINLLLSCDAPSGVAQLAERLAVNQ